MKKYFLIIIILTTVSCREEISLDFPKSPEKIVVQGAIEEGFPPYVILTKSQGYFDPINSNTFDDLFIKDAKVTVWKRNLDGTIDSIKLEQLPPPMDSIPIYTDTNYIISSMNSPYLFSEEGGTYHLSVEWEGKSITSITTIPHSTPLDEIWIEPTEDITDKDFACDIRTIYTDPDTIGNNILVKSKRIEHWIRQYGVF